MPKKGLIVIFLIIASITIYFCYSYFENQKTQNAIIDFENEIIGHDFVSISEYTANRTYGSRVKIRDRNDLTVHINSNFFLELYQNDVLFKSGQGEAAFYNNNGRSLLIFSDTLIMVNNNDFSFKFYKEDGYYFLRIGRIDYIEYKMQKV